MTLIAEYNESKLVSRLKMGDEKAFSLLFYRYKKKLFSFIFDLTQSELKAEDIVQDVFLKIWQNREHIAGADNFNAYVFRMAQNHAIDQLRKLSREIAIVNEFQENGKHISGDPEVMLLNKEIRQKIQEAVAQLPAQQKKVFVLHREQGLRHEEIAKEMNLSVSTVQNHLFRAVTNIRNYLATTYPETSLFMAFILFSFIK